MTIEASTPTLGSRRDALTTRLMMFRRHVVRHLLFAGVARIVALFVVGCIVSLLLDRWLRLSLPMRVIFLLAGLVGLGMEVWKGIIVPMQLRSDLVGIAAAIDRARHNRNGTSLAPRVATVLELPELLNRTAPPSPAMVERAVVAADDALHDVDFESNLDVRRHKFNFGSIIAIGVVSLLLIALNFGTFGLWARRWFAGSNEPWPQKTYLEVLGLGDGRIIVPRGEPFTLRLTTTKESSVIPESISLRLREGKGPRASAAMNKFANNDFRYDLPAVQVPVTITASGGDDEIEPFVVEPVDRPKIKSLLLTSQHPTEEKPAEHNFGGQDADLAFLPKTRLQLRFTGNVTIDEAKVSGAPAEVKRVSDSTFTITWTQEKPVAMQIEMISAKAKLTSLPTPVTIGLKVDQPPRVSLAFSGVRQRITPMAKIPLTILARDDSGIAEIALASKADFLDSDKKQQTIAKSKTLFGPTTSRATETEIQEKETFDVTGLKITPGTILSLTAGATDQRYEAPQTGVSRAATFRVVEPQELFREILLRQQSERAKFRKQIDESNKIKESLSTLAGTESGPALARQHRNVQREVSRIGTTLAESILEMCLNGLGTTEAYDLMEKNVLAPLKQLDAELMTPQRDALDALGSQSVKMEEVIARQEQIVARLQQILKQMSQWDSFVDVLNQLNEIIRLQEGVKVGTDALKTKQVEGIFDK